MFGPPDDVGIVRGIVVRFGHSIVERVVEFLQSVGRQILGLRVPTVLPRGTVVCCGVIPHFDSWTLSLTVPDRVGSSGSNGRFALRNELGFVEVDLRCFIRRGAVSEALGVGTL